jgi:hypothetical protein
MADGSAARLKLVYCVRLDLSTQARRADMQSSGSMSILLNIVEPTGCMGKEENSV